MSRARRSMVGHDDSKPFIHRPVMVDEVVALIADVPAGEVLDATVGGGGHTAAILDSRPDLRVVGLDQDPTALAAAERHLVSRSERVRLVRARFDRLAQVLADIGVERLSGFLFDLGVSSPQLDSAERGFSFRHDGPLDMRMDTDQATSAADVVNTYTAAELARVLRRHADERFANRIAEAIVAARPVDGTARLADVVVSAVPAAARRGVGHPARRTFQAIRIEVNDELAVIEPALVDALERLDVGGRGIVLTYHSGEDRIVKDVFRRSSTSDDPPGLPVEVQAPKFAVDRPAARKATAAEQADNPRATSARLRSIQRLAA
ncbi:MAG: 16S rRNA (cytosine(1402)-N(4))-methyltransferase RsmH [Actinomycetota bacterium]